MLAVPTGFGGSQGAEIVIDGDCRTSGDLPRAILDGEGTVAHGIRTFKATDIRFKNLEIRNFSSTGIVLSDFMDTDVTLSRRITVEGSIYIHDIGSTGISSVGSDNTILAAELDNIGNDGITSSGRNVKFIGTRIRRVSYAGYTGDCIQLSGDIDGTEVQNVYCDHSNIDAKQCVVASNVVGAANFRIDGLECFFTPGGINSIGVYLEGHATIQHSYIYGAAKFGINIAARDSTSAYVLDNVIHQSGISCIEGSRGGAAALSAALIVAIGNTCMGASEYGINFNSANETRAANDNNIIGPYAVGISKGLSNTTESGNSIFGAVVPVAIGSSPTKLGSGSRSSRVGE